jgi:hypothetical protein
VSYSALQLDRVPIASRCKEVEVYGSQELPMFTGHYSSLPCDGESSDLYQNAGVSEYGCSDPLQSQTNKQQRWASDARFRP